MVGRGHAAGRSAPHRAPRREDRHLTAHRAGIHLAAGRYPQRRGGYRSRPPHAGRFRDAPVGRGAGSAGGAPAGRREPGDHGRQRDRVLRCVRRDRAAGRSARRARLPAVDPLRRAFSVRASGVHGRIEPRPKTGARRADALRFDRRGRCQCFAHVGLFGGRSAADRDAHRADLPRRLGVGQELPNRNGDPRRREGDPGRAEPGDRSQGRRRSRGDRAGCVPPGP